MKLTTDQEKIISKVQNGSLMVICIQDTGNKVKTLNQAIDFGKNHKRLAD